MNKQSKSKTAYIRFAGAHDLGNARSELERCGFTFMIEPRSRYEKGSPCFVISGNTNEIYKMHACLVENGLRNRGVVEVPL